MRCVGVRCEVCTLHGMLLGIVCAPDWRADETEQHRLFLAHEVVAREH